LVRVALEKSGNPLFLYLIFNRENPMACIATSPIDSKEGNDIVTVRVLKTFDWVR